MRSLFLATHEDGNLVYRGEVWTDFADKVHSQLIEVLHAAETRKRPQVTGMSRNDAHAGRWVKPGHLAEVEFIDITADGLIRSPSLRSLSHDTNARLVRLEIG